MKIPKYLYNNGKVFLINKLQFSFENMIVLIKIIAKKCFFFVIMNGRKLSKLSIKNVGIYLSKFQILKIP